MIAAIGNKNTSVCDKKGSARYPKWVMYQYQHKAAAYKLLLTTNANILVPNTKGRRKN